MFSVGPTIKEKFGDELKPGYWVIVKHGRWTQHTITQLMSTEIQQRETIGVMPEDVDKHVSRVA